MFVLLLPLMHPFLRQRISCLILASQLNACRVLVRVCDTSVRTAVAPSGRVYPSARPAMTVATATHRGGYEGLHDAGAALQTWLGAGAHLQRAAAAFPSGSQVSVG